MLLDGVSSMKMQKMIENVKAGCFKVILKDFDINVRTTSFPGFSPSRRGPWERD